VDLADDRIAAHAADFGRDLAGALAFGPELLELLDALIVPGHARIRHAASSRARRSPNPSPRGRSIAIARRSCEDWGIRRIRRLI